MKKTTQIIVRMIPKMKKEVIALARESRRETSDYVRLILEDAIKNKTKL